jgi:hypothetical protein
LTALQPPNPRIIQVVGDAGPLIAALESGIPTSTELLHGLTQIPQPDWSIRYKQSKAHAITTFTASDRTPGTNPFSVQLTRTVAFMGPDGILSDPTTSYRGAIKYSIGTIQRDVVLDSHPGVLASLIGYLENRLQEPSTLQQKVDTIEREAGAYASGIQNIITKLSQTNVHDARSALAPKLCSFLIEDARSALRSWADDGYRYKMDTIERAFLFAFATGDAVALARINVTRTDLDKNREDMSAVLIVASEERGKQRRVELVPQRVGSLPQALYDAAWRLTE